MEVSEGACVDAGAGAASPVQAPIRKVATSNTAKKRVVLTKSSECYHLQLVISGPPDRGKLRTFVTFTLFEALRYPTKEMAMEATYQFRGFI